MKNYGYYNVKSIKQRQQFTQSLRKHLQMEGKCFENWYIVCIGTDRVTGDCLGPLVGFWLDSMHLPKHVHVVGTLNDPVHALNLRQVIAEIKKTEANPYFIVVDASVGQAKHVGYITLSNQPLRPGEGVQKNLPKVGHLSITGIVNESTNKTAACLQTTRLSLVMSLAKWIAEGLGCALDPVPTSYFDQLTLQ